MTRQRLSRWVLCVGPIGLSIFLSLVLSTNGADEKRGAVLSDKELAAIWGSGEGQGCEKISSGACDRSKERVVCYDLDEGQTNPGCHAPDGGRQYSGKATHQCAHPANDKVADYEDVDCYQEEQPYTPENPQDPDPDLGKKCDLAETGNQSCTQEDAEPTDGCGYCELTGNPTEWVQVSSCVCLDP